jgi:hypothetical protein
MHHVVYLHDMRCIVYMPIFTSTLDHLPTMPEWLQAFKTMTSGLPIQQGQAVPSYITHILPFMPYVYASQVDPGSGRHKV